MPEISRHKPSILFVDDDPESVQSELSLVVGYTELVFTEVVHPNDLEADQIECADLILVDYHLARWFERDTHSSLTMKPRTGLSVTGVLRDHIDQPGKSGATAIALHTGYLQDIRGSRVASHSACHVVARLNNLEWIFEKPDKRRFEKMARLAAAVGQLPRGWPKTAHKAIDEVQRLLNMDHEHQSFERCWRDVRECQVPIYELTSSGHQIQFLRWILHQILPYPTFLRDKHRVAARLGITVAALHEVVDDGSSKLAKDLGILRYKGVLSDFLGERWWSGALEDYVWNLVQEGGGDLKRLQDILRERAGRPLRLAVANPVVCLNSDLEPDTEFSTPSEVLRLRPDHWPAFADFAWMRATTMRGNKAFLEMVDPLDIE